MQISLSEPSRDCPLCPRLAAFREEWRAREPAWFNAPVPTFLPPEGNEAVRLLIVGLAPGVRGANRTGRPFTGDYAGDLLYSTMIRFGLARGQFLARPDDGLELVGGNANAVRCVPPENKPVGAEISTCRRFDHDDRAVPNLRAILSLGAISHQSTVRAPVNASPPCRSKHGAATDTGSHIFRLPLLAVQHQHRRSDGGCSCGCLRRLQASSAARHYRRF